MIWEICLLSIRWFHHRSAIARTTHALVISLEAPETSPFTPPNRFLETSNRSAGHRIIMTKDPTILIGDIGRKSKGMQSNAAITGKYCWE
jgi:hypothetical protein